MLQRSVYRLFAFAVLIYSGISATAQTISIAPTPAAPKDSLLRASSKKPVPAPVKRPKPVTKELSAGLRLNSDGWTGFVEFGKVKTNDLRKIDMFHNVRIMQIEFSEKKHPKELKIEGIQGNATSGKKYIYGKTNNFYALKFNYGMQRMIAGKPYPNSVSVHLVYAGGLAVGLLKPYYVESAALGPIKYTPATSEAFLDPFSITGKAGFSEGISEIKIIPGLHLKTGLHFDFSRSNLVLAAAEIGASLEFYTQSIELMATQKSSPAFFNLYAGIQFGKRRR